MNKTYRAVYYNPSGRFFNAEIFLSTITLSIRYRDENNQLTDVYWLAENILSLEEQGQVYTLTYNNKEGRTERLVIRDMELLEAIRKNFSHHRFVGGWKHHILGNTRNKILAFFLVLILMIMAGYFWFIPWLGDRIARNVSKEWEISMGRQMHQSIMGEYKIDSSRTNLINKFYAELHYEIEYPVSITVVDSKELNAFAVPGGHIVVYSSLLDKMTKSEELAALLSHEASHINLRHSLRNIFRSMARKMFLMMIVGNESGLAGFLVDNADNLKGLEYSRSLETEADNHGMRLMNSGNLDVSGMLGLMLLLQEETRGKELPGFLSTHPVFDSRIINIKKQITATNNHPLKNELLESLFQRIQQPGGKDDW